MNALHYDKKEHLETRMEAWSNDVYEKVPFTCDARLNDKQVRDRINSAVYKRFKPYHSGGCGYSCDVHDFQRESKVAGFVVLRHYHGIGD